MAMLPGGDEAHRAVQELLIQQGLTQQAVRQVRGTELGGNKSEAANRLQISRRLLYNEMAEHHAEE